mgnify:CR=1 FL=1
MSTRKTALVVAPGRGTYGKGELGSIARLHGARFADQNGFTALWTPERHFHAFGGPYPNPSVTGAAAAAVTTRAPCL